MAFSHGTSPDRCDASHEHVEGGDKFQSVCVNGGTEPARSGLYDKETNHTGVYRCACCGEILFRAEDQYDSGTGWPSFVAPVEGAVGYRKDLLQLGSVEVHCHRCGAHLGHVFEDGPEPTGLRYCINSVCLWRDPLSLANADFDVPWVAHFLLVLVLVLGGCCSCCFLASELVGCAGQGDCGWMPCCRKTTADDVVPTQVEGGADPEARLT